MPEFVERGGIAPEQSRSARCIAEYDRLLALGSAHNARAALVGLLAGCPEHEWLDCSRTLALRNDLDAVESVCVGALAEHPESTELRYVLAGTLRQTRRDDQAESLLRGLLEDHPDHVAATFLLTRLLKDEGRTAAAAAALRFLFRQSRPGTEFAIQAVELLDDCGRKEDAAAICEAEIAAGSSDVRLYAYAATLEIQLGEFEQARRRYTFVLANSPLALEWQAPLGLAVAQRYTDASHADFRLFRESLQRPDLSDKARASLGFALGKALDDIGDYAEAALFFNEANATVRSFAPWSRKQWRRAVEMRMAARSPSARKPVDAREGAPLFVVGAPRSGTTLIAELLSRHPQVCNRGELVWLPFFAGRLSAAGNLDRASLDLAAEAYLAQLRQDDGDEARWFIDKRPLNFMHVDLIMALFPDARIIYCRRNARDTALSLWQQFFAGADQNFAYDFADIATLIRGCSRLMTRWLEMHGAAIHSVQYEQLASDPATCLRSLTDWLDLPPSDLQSAERRAKTISTSSLWQARQPVYTRSIGRWKAYAPYLPELLQLPED